MRNRNRAISLRTLPTGTRSLSGRKGIKLLPALLASVLLLGACAGGSDSDQVASLANDSTSSSKPSPTASANQEKEALAYVECLRGQGLDISDPTVDADGNLTLGRPSGAGNTFDRDKFTAAQKVCGDVPAGLTNGFTGGDQSALQDAALKFAACMRGKGVDVADPDFSNGMSGMADAFGDLDQDNPKVAAALEVCQKVFADAGINQPGTGSN